MREKGTFLGEIERGWQRFWGLSWWWKGPVIGVVAVVLVGGIASIFDGGNEDESALLVDATVTSSPVETSATDTPSPSPVDSQTETPKPTAVPTPTANVEALTYLASVAVWLDEGLRLSEEVVEISGSDNPFSEGNAERALRLTLDTDNWRDDALAFDAPSEFDEVQMWLELAGVTMAESLDEFWRGVTLVDADLIFSASEKLLTAVEYMNNATAAMTAVEID